MFRHPRREPPPTTSPRAPPSAPTVAILPDALPIPQELMNKINNAAKFNSGFSTVEALSSALVDMKIHLAGNKKIDPKIVLMEII